MIRVAVVDDQDLIRHGLRTVLAAEDDIEIVGESADGSGAERMATARLADVILMDIEMPGLDGLEATREVIAARPETRVLVLTMFDLDEYVFGALKAGASGFLLKTTPPDELADAVRACYSGELLFAPEVTRRLVSTFVRRPPRSAELPSELDDLTPREIDVLRSIAGGLSNAEVAEALHLSVATVKTHVTRVLAKLELRDRVQAVVLAYECGLVEPQDQK